MTGLDAELLAAHVARDTAALVALYQQAAAQTGNAEQAAFYLTNAHVFAMESAHPDAASLRARLVALGREAALQSPSLPLR